MNEDFLRYLSEIGLTITVDDKGFLRVTRDSFNDVSAMLYQIEIFGYKVCYYFKGNMILLLKNTNKLTLHPDINNLQLFYQEKHFFRFETIIVEDMETILTMLQAKKFKKHKDFINIKFHFNNTKKCLNSFMRKAKRIIFVDENFGTMDQVVNASKNSK